jgi:hypothetical protein
MQMNFKSGVEFGHESMIAVVRKSQLISIQMGSVPLGNQGNADLCI